MAYTEIKERNSRKYFYRVISIRNGKKVSKKRIYLGLNLSKKELLRKEMLADKELNFKGGGNKEIEKIKSKIIKVLKKNKVKRAGIVGSYARGEQKKNSDIDIVIEIDDKNMSLLDFVRLKLLLEHILKRKTDLVEYDAIKPQIKKRMLEEEVRII